MNALAPVRDFASRLLGESVEDWWARFRFGSEKRLSLYEDLHSFVSDGIPPMKAISKMHVVLRKRGKQRALERILGSTAAAGSAGQGLASALGRWLPGEEAALIRVGERTGDFEAAFARLRELLARKVEIRAALNRELGPAAAMVVALCIVGPVVQSTLLTLATEMLDPADLASAPIAGPYIEFAALTLRYGLAVLLLAVGLGVWIALSLPRWRPSRVRTFVDERVAPWSLYRRQVSTFFLVSAAAMMRAGTPFGQTVQELQRTASPWSRTHMQRMLLRLGTGATPVQAMETGLLPQDVEGRLAIYSELPNVADVMESSAKGSISILLKRTKATGTIIKVLTMLAFALFILATLATQFELTAALEAAAKRDVI